MPGSAIGFGGPGSGIFHPRPTEPGLLPARGTWLGEIQALPVQPTVWLRLNDASGNPQDISGKGNHVNAIGGTPDYRQPSLVPSDPGNLSMGFDGSSEYLRIPHAASLNDGDVFTRIIAFARNRSGVQEIFESKENGSVVYGFDSGANVDKLAVFKFAAGQIARSTVTVTDTNQHLLQISKNGAADFYIMLDGVDVTSFIGDLTVADNTSLLQLGADGPLGPSLYFQGRLDEYIRIPAFVSRASGQSIYAGWLGPTAATVVTPDPATLVLTGFAPDVAVTNNQLVTPGTASLILTGLAPVIGLGIIPPTAALTVTTFAPTVTASNHQTATPATAALTLSTFAPSVSVSNNQTATPGTASLVLTSFAPVVSTPRLATPGVAALTLTTFAPTVSLSDNKLVVPGTAALVLTTFAPGVTGGAGVTATPGVATLTLSAFAPVVTTTNHQTATPETASLSLTTFAPTVTLGANQVATPNTASLTLSPFAPVVTASDHKRVIVGLATLTLAFFAPTVSVAAADTRGYGTLADTLRGRLTLTDAAVGTGTMGDAVVSGSVTIGDAATGELVLVDTSRGGGTLSDG